MICFLQIERLEYFFIKYDFSGDIILSDDELLRDVFSLLKSERESDHTEQRSYEGMK